MLTLGLEQDIYKCIKIECSDAKNRKIKIGDAISVRKEKEATSLKTCQILI